MLLALFGIVNFAVALPLYTLGARHLPAIETALIGALDAPGTGQAKRVGFMSGQIAVPDDFDRIGSAEIERLFGDGQ